jgi:hypothetical protein
MSWSNVPTKNPGEPVTAENWNGVIGNFAALADGLPGAPRILVPNALKTTETNTARVLVPDGAGGVAWGSALGALAGGERLNLDGGEPVTTVPNDRLIWNMHGTVKNTAYHNLVLPTPNAEIAGHLVTMNFEQTGSYGGTRIRVGSAGGSILDYIEDGDSYWAIYACNGNRWFPVSIRHIVPEDDN